MCIGAVGLKAIQEVGLVAAAEYWRSYVVKFPSKWRPDGTGT